MVRFFSCLKQFQLIFPQSKYRYELITCHHAANPLVDLCPPMDLCRASCIMPTSGTIQTADIRRIYSWYTTDIRLTYGCRLIYGRYTAHIRKWKNKIFAWLTMMEMTYINPTHICFKFEKVFDTWHFQRRTWGFTCCCFRRHFIFSVKNRKNVKKRIFGDLRNYLEDFAPICVQELIFLPLLLFIS